MGFTILGITSWSYLILSGAMFILSAYFFVYKKRKKIILNWILPGRGRPKDNHAMFIQSIIGWGGYLIFVLGVVNAFVSANILEVTISINFANIGILMTGVIGNID